MKLTDLNTVRGLLKTHDAMPDKRYGQNFLISERVVSDIAEKCGASKDDGILEIGPGIGVLSKELCERYKKVTAVEIDKKMIEILSDSMAEYNNFSVFNSDILKIDLKSFLAENFSGMNVTVCANLPYYITSPIIMHLLESGAEFEHITVMIQREVADRLTAKPGTPDYGSITPVIEYYADAVKILSVPAGCFYPAPKVDSAVVRLDLRKKPEYEPKSRELMFEVIRYAFLQRRKTLSNALGSSGKFSKDTIRQALDICGVDERARGETLSLLQFKQIADSLYELTQ